METDSENDGPYRRVPRPQCPTQQSNTEESYPGETPMDVETPDTDVHPTAGRTISNDPNYNEFQDLINNLWQPWYCAEDFTQAIRFVDAHYLKSRMDRLMNEGRCKDPNHYSYTCGWMMNNHISRMDNQLPPWRAAFISTPNSRRFSYF